MSQSQVREPNSFGKRKEPHSIVITRNGQSRQYSVNPIYFSLLAAFMAMFSVGYFASTAYLVLRDDLISARGARDTRMHHEYEDRIAALRANLDRITSRQLLDQQAIETKVAKLVQRQNSLRDHNPVLKGIFERAKSLGLDVRDQAKDNSITKSPKVDQQASLSADKNLYSGNLFSLRGVESAQNQNFGLINTDPQITRSLAFTSNNTHTKTNNKSLENFDYDVENPIFLKIAQSISKIDLEQKLVISSLRIAANIKLVKIRKLMEVVGVKLPKSTYIASISQADPQIGGPFEPLDRDAEFGYHLDALGTTLSALHDSQINTKLVPLANPSPGKSISSRFGGRIDPFKGTYAMHSGLDFKANSGSSVLATASGKVVHAGRKGGYGKMVEIKHANGFTTRYAHLSRILVREGQAITLATKIGEVGSTGRSTGPHLHYEIRRRDVALNPKKFLTVGKKLANLI